MPIVRRSRKKTGGTFSPELQQLLDGDEAIIDDHPEVMNNNAELLHLAVFEDLKNDIAIVKLLLDIGVDPNSKNEAVANNDNYKLLYDKAVIAAGESKQFTQVETTDRYTFYHFCLENDGDKNRSYIVWANGMLAETTYEDQFKDKNKFESVLAA